MLPARLLIKKIWIGRRSPSPTVNGSGIVGSSVAAGNTRQKKVSDYMGGGERKGEGEGGRGGAVEHQSFSLPPLFGEKKVDVRLGR